MSIKKNDFVEIEYTGRLKDDNIVFDTTDESVANKNNINSKNTKYGPVIVCVGQQHVVKGLDEFFVGKDVGTFSVEILPENAFGKKDAKLIAMVPTKKFLEQKIQPMPGLQVNIDGVMGIIRAVNGGRTVVDFNHPLSGKIIVYDVKINRLVTDKKEKANALARLYFSSDVKIFVDGDIAKIESVQDVPGNIVDDFKKQFKELAGVELEFVKPRENEVTQESEKDK